MEYNDSVKKGKYKPLVYVLIALIGFFAIIYLRMFGFVEIESEEFIEGTVVYVITVLCLFSLPVLIYLFIKLKE